jgi:hypothetical protein
VKALCLLFLLIACTGCASLGSATTGDASRIQRALDAMLPPTFTGSAHVDHVNPYFGFTIDAGGLRRTPQGWHWDWLRFKRNGFFSRGSIQFGTPPVSLFP